MIIENGKTVRINYSLTVNGELVDSTNGREPFQYVHGKDQIIPGLQKRLEGLKVGDTREVVVGPEDAYGVIDPAAYVEVQKSELPEGELDLGMQFQVVAPDGRRLVGIVTEIKAVTVILNFNHPLAGKELHFSIQIIEIL